VAKIQDVDIPHLEFAEGAAPGTPASAIVRIYAKADGLLYSKDDAGAETLVSGGAGGLTDHDHTGGGDGGDLDSPIIDGYAVFNEESAPGSAGANTVRVYAKSDGLMYSKDDAGAETALGGSAGGGVAVATVIGDGSADYTTTSTSFADVNASLSITTTTAQSGDKLEIELTCATDGGNTGNAGLTFSVAGTDVGDTLGIEFLGNAEKFRGSFHYIHTMASGTQVTIKARWKTASGTFGMYNRSVVVVPRMTVKNLTRSGTL
jgi:hypothetical protein